MLTLALWLIHLMPAFAQTGQALSFDGDGDYVALPSGVYFSGNLTIEAWVYPRSAATFGRVIDFGNGPENKNVILALSKIATGIPYFEIEGQQVVAPQALPLNQWTHLAATLNGTTATLYVNGIVSATAVFANPPSNVTRNNCYIGRSNWAADAYANVIIDDLRIWNVARTATQLAENRDCEQKGTETGLVVYYTFNQGTAGGTNTGLTSLTNAVSGGVAGTLTDFSLTGSTSNWVAMSRAVKCVNCNTYVTRTTADGLGNNIVKDVFVVGNTVYAATEGGLSISTDGGKTFLNQIIAPTTTKTGRIYTTGNTIYAIAKTVDPKGITNGTLARSTDGGQSFSIINTSSTAFFSLYASDNTIITTKGGGAYILSTNGGGNFAQKTLAGNSAPSIQDAFGMGNNLYMAANSGKATPLGGLYVSADGGQSFILNSNLNTDLQGTSVYVAGNKIYYGAKTGLFISTTGGASFVQRTTANGLGSNVVNDVFAVGDRVYVATDNGLSISTDGGTTFTNHTIANGLAAAKINAVYAVGTTVYVATGAGLSIADFGVQINNAQIATTVSVPVGQSVTLTAAATNTNYTWSNNNNTQSIIVNATNLYSVTTTGDCPGSASIQVSFFPTSVGTATGLTTLSTTNCPVKLTATGLIGQRFQATGPNGYVFNDAYPSTVTNKDITLTNIRQAGTYTLYSFSAIGTITAANTYTVSGSGCK